MYTMIRHTRQVKKQRGIEARGRPALNVEIILTRKMRDKARPIQGAGKMCCITLKKDNNDTGSRMFFTCVSCQKYAPTIKRVMCGVSCLSPSKGVCVSRYKIHLLQQKRRDCVCVCVKSIPGNTFRRSNCSSSLSHTAAIIQRGCTIRVSNKYCENKNGSAKKRN